MPEDTNLNHYFEIRNNRGEQLEKHQILKSRIMEKFQDNESRSCFNTVWEACAKKYVQMGFSQRSNIFGDGWGNFCVMDFNTLKDKIGPSSDSLRTKTLDAIIKSSNESKNNNQNDFSITFCGSIAIILL